MFLFLFCFVFNAVLAQTGKKCMTAIKVCFSAGWLVWPSNADFVTLAQVYLHREPLLMFLFSGDFHLVLFSCPQMESTTLRSVRYSWSWEETADTQTCRIHYTVSCIKAHIVSAGLAVCSMSLFFLLGAVAFVLLPSLSTRKLCSFLKKTLLDAPLCPSTN